MPVTIRTVEVPSLDHDAMMEARFGHKLSPQNKRERRIFAALVDHLAEAGWTPSYVNWGQAMPDPDADVTDKKGAMELLFNLDDAWVGFKKGEAEHVVYIVLGNDTDIVTDWTAHRGDHDGFGAAMDTFDAEDFA